MAKRSAATRNGKAMASATAAGRARSRVIAKTGVTESLSFKRMMSSLMSDLIEGRVQPQVGNAVCNAGGKLLKVVEMEYRYSRNPKGAPSPLLLTE